MSESSHISELLFPEDSGEDTSTVTNGRSLTYSSISCQAKATGCIGVWPVNCFYREFNATADRGPSAFPRGGLLLLPNAPSAEATPGHTSPAAAFPTLKEGV